jgi:hypothetical protein
MNLFQNSQFRAALGWLSVSAVGLGLAALPFVVSMDMMNGGYALQCLSLGLLVPAGLTGGLIYLWRAFTLAKILRGEGLLAHWTYSPEEWSRYARAEAVRESGIRWVIFGIITFWALLFGGLCLLFDPGPGRVVFLGMLGLIAFVALVAWLSIAVTVRRNRKYLGEALIAPQGVYLNRALHNWNGMGARLDSTRCVDGEEGLLLVEFDYSYPARHGRQRESVRVPVPTGREAEARALVEWFTTGRWPGT